MAERPYPIPSIISFGFSVIFFSSRSLIYSSSWVKNNIPWLIPLVIFEVLLNVPFTVCLTKDVVPSANAFADSIGPCINPSIGLVKKSWKPFPKLFKKLIGLPKISIPPNILINWINICCLYISNIPWKISDIFPIKLREVPPFKLNGTFSILFKIFNKFFKKTFGCRSFSNIWSFIWAINVKLNSREEEFSSFINIIFLFSSSPINSVIVSLRKLGS